MSLQRIFLLQALGAGIATAAGVGPAAAALPQTAAAISDKPAEAGDNLEEAFAGEPQAGRDGLSPVSLCGYAHKGPQATDRPLCVLSGCSLFKST